MGKKIIIELDGNEQDINEIVKNIEAVAVGEIGKHELENYSIRKETFPEKNSQPTIKTPLFMEERRLISQQEKGLVEAIHGKGGMQNG
ncbi:MAG: hypothetical protein NC307_11415 [Roseburia sp.]|nr:hypothetical protein [Roseburia sp.]